MANEMNLALPMFYYVTMAEYQAGTKDGNALYFIKGTSLVYKGGAPYGSTIKQVTELPESGSAVRELHYVITSGTNAGIYVLNSAGDGYDNVSINKTYVDDKVKNLFADVAYNAETAELTFTRANNTEKVINLPKENFLSAATFNAETNILTLELADTTKVDVPLGELLDVYTGDDTDTMNVDVSTEGKITANAILSELEGNALEVADDGMYVKKTPIVTPGESSTTTDAASAKAVYDTFKSMAWSESL